MPGWSQKDSLQGGIRRLLGDGWSRLSGSQKRWHAVAFARRGHAVILFCHSVRCLPSMKSHEHGRLRGAPARSNRSSGYHWRRFRKSRDGERQRVTGTTARAARGHACAIPSLGGRGKGHGSRESHPARVHSTPLLPHRVHLSRLGMASCQVSGLPHPVHCMPPDSGNRATDGVAPS